MAEQIMSKAITKAVTKATRIVIQTMAEMQTQRITNASWTQARQSHIKTTKL